MPPAVGEVDHLEESRYTHFLLTACHFLLGGERRGAWACAHLSRVDCALQWRLLLAQVGVGVVQPGQGGAVGVEVWLLVWRVEEPALQQQQEVSEAVKEI